MSDTTNEESFGNAPKPPKIGMWIAVVLELTMVALFIRLHSMLGMVCAIAYFWFSATWALAFSHYNNPKP